MTRLTLIALQNGRLPADALEAWQNARRFAVSSQVLGALAADQAEQITLMDDLYQAAEDFDTLAQAVADRLVQAAEQGPAAYAVGGSVLCDRAAILALQAAVQKQLPCQICGEGPAGQAMATALCLMPFDTRAGWQLLPARGVDTAHLHNHHAWCVTELADALTAGAVKAAFSRLWPDEQPVVLVQGGADGPTGRILALYQLDRQDFYDHTTAVVFPPLPAEQKARFTTDDLQDILTRLRAPDGCPWDREQTHQTLRKHLLEEACEAMDAIDRQDDEAIADELGDVLLQVVFNAQVGQSRGGFDYDDVTTAVCTKMITRHPHVFGDVQVADSAEVLRNWEKQKRTAQNQTLADSLQAVARTLPGLSRADKVFSRLVRAEYPLPQADALLAEITRLATLLACPQQPQPAAQPAHLLTTQDPAQAAGGLLLAVTCLLHQLGIEPEAALQGRLAGLIDQVAQDSQA